MAIGYPISAVTSAIEQGKQHIYFIKDPGLRTVTFDCTSYVLKIVDYEMKPVYYFTLNRLVTSRFKLLIGERNV